MTTDQIPAARPNSGKTLMDLGHLAMPNSSHPPKSWLASQAEQREKARTCLKSVARQYFPESLPDYLFDAFAAQATDALDNL